MKKLLVFLITSSIALGMMNACGPSEEEIQRRKQARQDSLERVRQQRLAQMKQDSIEQARQDSIEAAKKRKRERNRITFDSDGAFAVQVESWRSKDKAKKQVQKWVERGYENAYTVKFGNEETGDVWFRVRLGHLPSKKMAKKLQDKIQRKYSEPSWISLTTDGTSKNTTD
ncbi:Sporulation related domain-containing protein [Fodinibius salinus]|uniref:Sporulation related domain-containing protein n=1 Tax=Fodinibius salinus TaxID=860790 RepID=A0A5D3YHZ9_9BACT|nr:SPOR domain-containing protein [Fodinibius salinus]TYP93393.1 Sporulation related domain-containing protein [Fodinibius salinus]